MLLLRGNQISRFINNIKRELNTRLPVYVDALDKALRKKIIPSDLIIKSHASVIIILYKLKKDSICASAILIAPIVLSNAVAGGVIICDSLSCLCVQSDYTDTYNVIWTTHRFTERE